MKKIIGRDGREIVLLNPSEKGQRYALELRENFSGKTGETLTKAQRSYRSGYLDARKDSAKAWKHNQKKKTTRRRKK